MKNLMFRKTIGRFQQFRTKAASSMSKSVVSAAILTCLVVAGAGSASAANPVLRNLNPQTITGQCCVPFGGESVSIVEPAKLEPVVVIWSSGYEINVPDAYYAGLSVNGASCSSFGPQLMPDYSLGGGFPDSNVAFQWIIFPSDGVLRPGNNTFELCGGGLNSGDSITINYNTLSVQLVK